MGLFGLGLPSDVGGVGSTRAEEALAFREIGRALAVGPILSTVLGAHLAAAAGADDLVHEIVAGEVAVAFGQPAGIGAEVGARCRGRFRVLDAPGSELVLLVGEHASALVSATALAEVEVVPCIDPTVQLGFSTIGDVEPTVWRALADLPLDVSGTVLAAAILVGISEAARDMSVHYVKSRVQFGLPIGAFQAVKHRCADMALRAEVAMAQTFYAALTVAEGRPDAAFQSSAAKVVALDAALRNATQNIQNHGAIGFTVEVGAHRFLRRARVLEHVLGGPEDHLARLVAAPPAQ